MSLPCPAPGVDSALRFVTDHLVGYVCDDFASSQRFRGGQEAAELALQRFDVTGYAARRNEVYPQERRGASQLSPYIRHGLLPLRRVWDHVAGGPPKDVRKFRDELLWQEFARHWYARHGRHSGVGLRREQAAALAAEAEHGWDRTMACINVSVNELERDGWLVNQTRMWLASHWSVRQSLDWRAGEDYFFAHLLDGSRAANRLGWQWTSGVGSAKPYGFSRWQVEKRAPGLCDGCVHRDACPIQEWPQDAEFELVSGLAESASLVGPLVCTTFEDPEAVWLTAESLGTDDPALAANPELPAVFVFDTPLLRTLRLSSKRLVFLVESLAELGATRPVELHAGDPKTVLQGRALAVTHAPVPGFAQRASKLRLASTHPWPWLVSPTSGSVRSFSAWRKSVGA